MIRKLISEFIGTMLLVVFGCGTAVAANQYVTTIFGVGLPFNMLLISAAFGLVLMALVYTIGKVSGCHVNPAVSVACCIDGRMSIVECVEYIVFQVLGAICGAAILGLIFGGFTSLGANGYDTLSALPAITTLRTAIIVEVILTFVFVLVVLSATAKESDNAGIVIGLALALVHILGLPFTGTSVNPARSLGPALFTGGVARSQVWVFIVAPLIGGIMAALFYKLVIAPSDEYEIVEIVEDEEEPKKEVKKSTKKDK